MNLKLKRTYKGDQYTIGHLYIEDQFFCDTIEDIDRGLDQDMPLKEIREKKIYGVTAIPTGTYQVMLTYSGRFKKILPLIANVPGFDGIRIHSGNTEKDSLGCVIVGENKVKGQVINSRITMNKLMPILSKAEARKEKVFITIE